MLYLDLTLSNAAVSASLAGDGENEAWMIVSPRYEVPLGEALLLRVRCEAAPEGVFLEGVVQWRRGTPTAGQPAGVGVRLMAHSVSRWNYLRELVVKAPTPDRRSAPRLPLRMPVILVTAPKGSTRIYPCTMIDVSVDGACLTLNHRLGTGERGRCEWAVGARTFAVQFRVAWATAGRIGIRIVDAAPGVQTAWTELFESTRAALDTRRTPPRSNPSGAVAIRTDGRSGADEERISTRLNRGSLPDRAIVEISEDSVRKRDPRSS